MVDSVRLSGPLRERQGRHLMDACRWDAGELVASQVNLVRYGFTIEATNYNNVHRREQSRQLSVVGVHSDISTTRRPIKGPR
jgi:hypothetical protein